MTVSVRRSDRRTDGLLEGRALIGLASGGQHAMQMGVLRWAHHVMTLVECFNKIGCKSGKGFIKNGL